MEEQIVDQLQLAADAIAENLHSLRRELRAKTGAMRKMEEELAELRGQVPRLMGEAEGLRQELREAVQERDALTIKLASAEQTNLEQKRALENLTKVVVKGLAPPSTSSISKTTKQETDTRSAVSQDSKRFKSHPSTSDPMDLSYSIPEQGSEGVIPGKQTISGTVEPSALDLPLELPSQSTSKPRTMARIKSTPKRSQSKTSEDERGEEGSVNGSGASAGWSSSTAHGPQCLCGKRFESVNNLRKHIDYGSGKLSRLCNDCGKRCGSASNLKAHKRVHHPNATADGKGKVPPSTLTEPMMTDEEGMFAVGCPECPATFTNDEELTTHVMEVHKKGEK